MASSPILDGPELPDTKLFTLRITFFNILSFFFLPFFALVATGGILLNEYSKEVLLLSVNSRFSAFGDVFFRYYTHMGDGVTYLIFGVLIFV